MKVQYLSAIYNNTPYKKTNQKHIFKNMPNDTFQLSFSGLKKHDFGGLDLAIVERFKAPIQNFKSKDDFNKWAINKTNEYLSKEYKAPKEDIAIQRKAILQDWYNYLNTEGSAYVKNPAWGLLIMSSITKDLKSKTNKIPPVLNPGALAASIDYMQQVLKEQPKAQLNFSKIYNEKLQEIYSILLNEDNSNTKEGVWIKIPSKENDPLNFSKNVDKLKALSHQNWCTKSTNAEPYLKDGDFHIYLVDNKPKVGIRFKGDEIEEIQGPRNNCFIPIDYADEVRDYVKLNSYKGMEEEIEEAVEKKEEFALLKEELAEAIENKDWLTILNHPAFNYRARKLDNGLLEVGRYSTPEYFFLSDLGIKENELFDNIERITGSLDLFGSDVARFKNLKSVEGNVYLEASQVNSTGSLERIGGNFTVSGAKTKIAENLIEVKGDVEALDDYPDENEIEAQIFENKLSKSTSKEDLFDILGIQYKKLEDGTYAIKDYIPTEFTSLEALDNVGITEDKLLDGVTQILGNVDLEESELKTFHTVEKIKGSFNIDNNSSFEDTGALKFIGGNFNCIGNNSLLEFGDNLRKINGDLLAQNSDLRSINSLKTIGGNCDIRNTPMRQTMYLTSVGGDLDMRGSDVQRIYSLKNVGGAIILDEYLAEILDEQLGSKGLWHLSEIRCR